MPLADIVGSELPLHPPEKERPPYLRILWFAGTCLLTLYSMVSGYQEDLFVVLLAIMACLSAFALISYDQEKMLGNISPWKLRRKVANVEDTIFLLEDFDRDWNLDLMEELARDTFMEVNKAWVGKNWEMLKDRLSYEILDELGTLILTMERLGQSHVLEDLTITDLRLVKL